MLPSLPGNLRSSPLQLSPHPPLSYLCSPPLLGPSPKYANTLKTLPPPGPCPLPSWRDSFPWAPSLPWLFSSSLLLLTGFFPERTSAWVISTSPLQHHRIWLQCSTRPLWLRSARVSFHSSPLKEDVSCWKPCFFAVGKASFSLLSPLAIS